MTVSNGSNADETTFNNAFVSKNADSTTTGKVNLSNADAASGAALTNIQREINSLDAYTGRPIGTAHDAIPIWVNTDLGSSIDTLKARLEALTAAFDATLGHNHDGTDGEGGAIPLASVSVAGTVSTAAQSFAGDKTFLGSSEFQDFVELSSTDPASGATLVNIQREINSLDAYTGRPIGTAHDATPVWSSNLVGTSVDTLKARTEALTLATVQWIKYTVTHTNMQTAALTNNITLLTLPIKGMIEGIVVKHSTAFAGTSITAYSLDIGISGDLDKYLFGFDVFSAVSGSNFQIQDLKAMESFTATTLIKIQATSIGANLSASTAGSVDIWVKTSTLP